MPLCNGLETKIAHAPVSPESPPRPAKSETLAADPIFMAALRTRTYPGGMYSRDYVIRMIQQFVVLLARIAGLKAKDDPEILLLETEAGLRQFTGMDPELVRSLSAAALLTILSARDPEDHTALAVAAILLKTEGEAYAALADHATARKRFVKSLALLEKVDEKFLPAELREHVRFADELRSKLPGGQSE